jgi:hypothetical protein
MKEKFQKLNKMRFSLEVSVAENGFIVLEGGGRRCRLIADVDGLKEYFVEAVDSAVRMAKEVDDLNKDYIKPPKRPWDFGATWT